MPDKRKIQQKSENRKLQASRFKEPPPKLKALIELVNCFPSNQLQLVNLHPDSLRAVAEEDIRLRLGADVDTDRFLELHFTAEIIERVEVFPPKLRDYVLHGRSKGFETMLETLAEGTPLNRYWNVWSAHRRLHSIAQLAAKEEPEEYSGRSVLWNKPVHLPVLDKIDGQGFVRVSKDLFTEAMDEDDIEAARIRECAACNRIFWAGRITQKGCSARCGDIIRKRRYRERYRQGFYQGAKLTSKEQDELKVRRKTTSKKGK